MPFWHHVADPIADDHDHVPVLDDVGLVTESAMTWDHVRSRFLCVAGNGQLQDVVERVNFTLNAPAVLDVDERIRARREDVARAHDVGCSGRSTMLSPSVWARGS